MEKYGTLPEDIRFELNDWVLITPPEGGDGLDCVHACNRQDKTGTQIQWSYALPHHTNCPGCDEVMPNEVQGLYQMVNMDCPVRFSKEYIEQMFHRIARLKWSECEKKLFLTGDGYKNED